MAVIEGITIAKDEYKMLLKATRKYNLVVQAIVNERMSDKDKIERIDEITEDSYLFKKGE